MRTRYHKRRGDHRRQFLTLAQMAEMKKSEATVNAEQKRAGTNHPTVTIECGCRCCHGYYIRRDRVVADTSVAEEMRKRAASGA